MGVLLQDLRYALRMLRKAPGFTAVAVITLALGIGANTATFSIVNAVMLQALPYPESDRLMSIKEMIDRDGLVTEGEVSYPDFFDWRAGNHVFEGMASYHYDYFTLTGSGQPLHLSGATVSGEFFSVLRVAPFLGRGFMPEEEKPGARVVVLSHEFWQSEFGGDRSVIDRNITLNQQSYSVVGVMPPGFAFPIGGPNPPKLWRTMAADAETSKPEDSPSTARRSFHFLSVIARLKPDVSLQQAREEMNVIGQALAQQYPDTNSNRPTVKILPELEQLVADVRPSLIILWLSVGCVLLIACVNVANLLLVRASKRSKEIAIRTALGAGGGRIVRQLLTESFLLAIIGALVSIPLALGAIKLFLSFNLPNLPRVENIGLDGQVLAFTAAATILSSLAFGLVPALRLSRPNLAQSLKEGGPGRSSTTASHQRIRSVLVVAETALSLALLVTSGLFLRSFQHLVDVEPGFNPKNVLTFQYDLSSVATKSEQRMQFQTEFLRRLRNVPGVNSVGAIWPIPLSEDYARISVQIDGRPVPSAEEPMADLRLVSPEYFQTVGIPLLGGRDFSERDDTKSTEVVIINQAFAQSLFPNEDPIGKRITPGLQVRGERRPREIVAVVGNVKHRTLSGEFTPEFYVPYTQVPAGLTFCLRTAGDQNSLISAVRKEISSMDPNVPIYNIKPLEEYVQGSLAQPRFRATLMEVFVGLALALAGIGLYGVVAYSVVQRNQEIGIRMALGASQSHIMFMVLKTGLGLTIVGVVIGVIVAVLITPSFDSLLFGVKPLDMVTFIFAIGALAVVSLLASYIPARRATKVDPINVLKQG